MFERLREELMEAPPDFGEHQGYDGKAIESHSTGRVTRDTGAPSDRDADWGRHETHGVDANSSAAWTKVKTWFGYGLHLVADTRYEVPVDYRVTPASHSEVVQVSVLGVIGKRETLADRVVPAFVRAAVTGSTLRAGGAQCTFDFTHIDDTVQGMVALVDRLAKGQALPPIRLTTGARPPRRSGGVGGGARRRQGVDHRGAATLPPGPVSRRDRASGPPAGPPRLRLRLGVAARPGAEPRRALRLRLHRHAHPGEGDP